MKNKNILIIGSGGREHAICWKIKQSDCVRKVFCIPGNGGTTEIAENIEIPIQDFNRIIEFVQKNDIDLTIVGPEDPLVNGIVDAFESKKLPIFGPRKNTAKLEGSKIFAKNFMKRHQIPTADFEQCDDEKTARQYIQSAKFPLVIKLDGLAAGKGVAICSDCQMADDILDKIFVQKQFGQNPAVVFEEFLVGEEISIIALVSNLEYKLFTPSQDHKARFEGDTGPNTGGMGAYAPAPLATTTLIEEIKKTIILPTLNGLNSDGDSYFGFLYFGLMITKDGPKILEYNCRLGDPETQVILPQLESDMLIAIESALHGNFANCEWKLADGYTVGIVAASEGYPESYEKRKEISGLELVNNATIFHAGTIAKNGDLQTSGGRVLLVSAHDSSLKMAQKKAYQELDKISFDGMVFRKDIAEKGIKRIEQ